MLNAPWNNKKTNANVANSVAPKPKEVGSTHLKYVPIKIPTIINKSTSGIFVLLKICSAKKPKNTIPAITANTDTTSMIKLKKNPL